ncbi:heavy metal translocating P-type ATPase [Persicimonas caeni]|uniref:Heavy metal translocating P-type ATPase n=1 Tax=Persicimonas caeni TaxID=2292766 RepID=A0A4Y6PZJ2_PERCE|nr:heavy metal translocating P-type ATPase [Persicimonas caeni]QDG53683.1 heavy metal translocating P-type ATPase [Persicimonas caeni]QED34904.1 heavy metal translocating P-type ATPase [Persicimonas caeni]
MSDVVSDKRVDEALECAHCGLPVPGEPEGPGPHFCCPGCRAVYSALHEAGLEDFYQLREITGADGGAPVGEELPSAGEDFDAEWFTERHTRELADGTREAELYIEGVHCAGCVWITERMPQYVDGVVDARLDLPRARLTVRWEPEQGKLSKAADWLAHFGYSPHPIRGENSRARTRGERKLLFKVGVSWALAANVMLLALALYAGLDLANDAALATGVRWLSLVLATGSVLYGGAEFFRRAAVSIRSVFGEGGLGGLLKLSMDVPISLGIFVGWAHSAWATASGSGEIWFDSIAVLIAALLTARWLQIRGRRVAGDAADRLLSLIPTTARRVRDGEEEQVPVEELQIGDIIDVRPGEVVPADGTLVTGQTTAHRAVLTGESRPEPVKKGEPMHAGETNLGAPIRLEVAAVGEETRVGKLLAWVEERSRKRAPIVQKADRLGGIFVLVTVFAALVTGLVWWQIAPSEAVAHVVALLVVACPCALGMATPLALSVGVGQAARRGIYVKHDDVLEALAQVSWVVFDKTGTLTRGEMAVTDVVGSAEAVQLAAALESQSNHPIARALAAELDAQKLRERVGGLQNLRDILSDTVEHAGKGIEGVVGGRKICVGKPDWIAETAVSSFSVDEAVAQMTGRGHTPVAISVDGKLEAVVGIGDPIRDESAKFLRELERRGVQPVILSGDHPEVVAHVASELGIDARFAHGGVSPEGKAAFVSDLRERQQQDASGGRIAMVGDGVNDAAALQAADIGIAVDGGAEASLVAADVFMTRPGLEPVYELIEGSHRVMKVVHRNLSMSAGYNAIAVAAAAFGLIGPLIAAVAMPLSSVAVVVSSLVQTSFAEKSYGNSLPAHSDRAGHRGGGGHRVLVGDA